jgi:ParB family chromosome partitioning protein
MIMRGRKMLLERLIHNREPYAIRRLLTETNVPARDRRARFVGLEAYEAAGGILRDLFSEDQGGYLEDAALLDRLTKERLESAAAELREYEGWKWAEAHLDYPHSHGLRRLSIRQRLISRRRTSRPMRPRRGLRRSHHAIRGR